MRIRIGRHYWEIVTCKELPGNAGETRFHEGALVPRQIALLESDQEMRYTLLHELFHAASDDCGLGLTEDQVLGLENWFKKLEKHQSLSSLLDAYGERKQSTNKPKPKV
jgi:hypothetical protein